MPDPDQSILDVPAISGSYLFPQPRSVPEPFVVDVGEATLSCYHRVVDADFRTLVHFHGNGEAVADYLPDMADELAAIKLNSLFVEYRQYGDSTGRAQLVAMLGDGQAAMLAAGLPPERVIAFGRSIGSLYAIELSSREPQLAGLILESGISNPAARILKYANLSNTDVDEAQITAEAQRHFNHRKKLAAYNGPVLIMHTENDGMVGIENAEKNYSWVASSQKRLVRFPNGNHNSIMAMNYQEYFRSIATFAESLD